MKLETECEKSRGGVVDVERWARKEACVRVWELGA